MQTAPLALFHFMILTNVMFLFPHYMVNWFEKAKEILIYKGNEKNEVLESLIEDFFDVLMVNIIS